MGYRSQVRSVIYGDPDKIDALIAKHRLLGGKGVSILDDAEVYDIVRSVFDADATAAERPAEGNTGVNPIYTTAPCRVIDLKGDDWKWYSGYDEVTRWEELLSDANEMELNTEFVRIGEEDGDVENDHTVLDEGDNLIGVSVSIEVDIERVEPAVCEGS